ncbi:MAG TPA: heme exporter protein CcmB [Terriglobia bacterium]|nr:heme exporter protein CcmB [Terriglobia bacterium]
MNSFKIIWSILAKDLRVEWRNRETLASMCVFGLLIVFLFNFAFETAREETLRLLPAVLWVAIAFAGVLGFNRSFASERENACLEGMTLAPVDPSMIFVGKMLANLLFLGIAEVVMVFAATLWFNFSFLPALGQLLLIAFFGTLGYAALGTIFGAIAANTRMREVMLTVLQFPIAFWILMLSIDSTSSAMRGNPDGSWVGGVARVAGISVIFTVASFLLFEYVLEE